jgi:hypothetical protein
MREGRKQFFSRMDNSGEQAAKRSITGPSKFCLQPRQCSVVKTEALPRRTRGLLKSIAI